MIVAFVRHGSTVWNEEGRMQGRRDVPLSDRGRAEVEVWRKAALFGRLVPTATPWYSSPLRRATETAQILSGTPPRCDAGVPAQGWRTPRRSRTTCRPVTTLPTQRCRR